MKKFKFPITSLALATAFAIVISCSEQDEMPVANQQNQSNTQSLAGKMHSAGRVGGELSSVGDPLALETAKAWTANYRTKNPDDIRSHFFGFEIIQQILNEAGCVGIRIYYANDENGEKKLVLVGVDAEGNDLLPLDGEMMMMDGGEGNTIADASWPCPDYCPDEDL